MTKIYEMVIIYFKRSLGVYLENTLFRGQYAVLEARTREKRVPRRTFNGTYLARRGRKRITIAFSISIPNVSFVPFGVFEPRLQIRARRKLNAYQSVARAMILIEEV